MFEHNNAHKCTKKGQRSVVDFVTVSSEAVRLRHSGEEGVEL